MRVIKPEWKEVRARRRAMAPVAQKLADNAAGEELGRAVRSKTAARVKETAARVKE
jgi:hypothetical protein